MHQSQQTCICQTPYQSQTQTRSDPVCSRRRTPDKSCCLNPIPEHQSNRDSPWDHTKAPAALIRLPPWGQCDRPSIPTPAARRHSGDHPWHRWDRRWGRQRKEKFAGVRYWGSGESGWFLRRWHSGRCGDRISNSGTTRKKIHALFFVFYVLYFPLYITMQGALYPKRSVISQALSAEMVLYLNKVEQVTGAVT